jgi:hypothetical protein
MHPLQLAPLETSETDGAEKYLPMQQENQLCERREVTARSQ